MEFRSDKISNSSNPFLSCLRGRERKNGRALTVQEILEIEVEFGDFVVNNYWYCQQDSTVANYYQEFDEWKRWATTYFGEEDSEEVVVGIFLRGLSEPIRNQMPSSLPTSLNRAYWEAISIELSLQLSLQISTIMKDLFVKFPARSSEIKYDDSKDILVESTIQGSDNSDSNLLSDVKQKLDERCGFHGVSLIPIEGQDVEMVFDELPQRNFTVQQGKEAGDEPDLCTFETDGSCKLIGKQVVVAAPMIMAEPCTLTIKVNCHPFIDAFPLTECMVDSVGTKVLIFYSMMVAYEPNDRMISLQDVSSDYENLVKELPFNSHAKRTVENEFHILQLTDNRASFILSPCCVYDPGGLWKFVCDASRSLDLLHDKFCSRAVGVHQIRTWFNEIWVLNTLDDCFDGVFGVGIRDGFVGDTHVTIQTPRTREHGIFQSGSTYYFDEIQYSIIKFLVLDGLAATIISWVFGRLAWVIVLMASRLGNRSKRVNNAAFIELSTLHDAYVCILFTKILRAEVDNSLQARQERLQVLRAQLQRVQQRMKAFADRSRQEKTFHPGDWVLLKLQHYKQNSVKVQLNSKLSQRFYGPFQVLQKVGEVAYRLQLPEGSKVHPVFHASCLRSFKGELPTVAASAPPLPDSVAPSLVPAAVIDIRQPESSEQEFLICWENNPLEEATWMPQSEFLSKYPAYHLEDKVEFGEGSTDTGVDLGLGQETNEQYVQRPKRTIKQKKGSEEFVWPSWKRGTRDRHVSN